MSHPSVIKRLIIKDIQLNAPPLTLYFIVGLIALYLLTIESSGPFYAGSVILMSMVIVTSAHLIFSTVTIERNEQTLALILSLPVTFRQYTHAKICANLLAFGCSWLLLYGGTLWVIYSQPQIPNGLTVYATLLMTEMMAVFVLVLCAGLITESQTWVIVLVSITNICLSIFMFWLSSLAGIADHMQADHAVWNSTALAVLAGEIACMLVCLAITYWIQSRKKDFL